MPHHRNPILYQIKENLPLIPYHCLGGGSWAYVQLLMGALQMPLPKVRGFRMFAAFFSCLHFTLTGSWQYRLQCGLQCKIIKLLVSIDTYIMLLYTGTETNTVYYIYCQLPTSHCSDGGHNGRCTPYCCVNYSRLHKENMFTESATQLQKNFTSTLKVYRKVL